MKREKEEREKKAFASVQVIWWIGMHKGLEG
jgi:hypothetical protein